MSIPSIPGIPPITLPAEVSGEIVQRVTDSHLDGADGPRLLHAGEGSDWIPQGQGHDAGRGELQTTYNNGEEVLLSQQPTTPDCDPATLEEMAVILGGDPDDALDTSAPTKGGGVATDGEFIYVADTDAVYVYRRADVDAALQAAGPAGEDRPAPLLPDAQPDVLAPLAPATPPTVEAIDRIPIATGDGDAFNASYLTVRDGELYVGNFSVDGTTNFFSSGSAYSTADAELRRYTLDGDGGFSAGDYLSIEAPKYAQGAVVTDTGVLFTTSLGSGITAPADDLVFQATTDTPGSFSAEGDAQDVGHLPHYAQGLNVIDGKLWITFESAADKYRDKVDDPLGNVQIYDVDDLGLSADELGIDTSG